MGAASIWTLMPVFFSNSGRFARRTSSLKPASIDRLIVLPCAHAVEPATRHAATTSVRARTSPARRRGPLAEEPRWMVFISTPVLSARTGPGLMPGPPRLHDVVDPAEESAVPRRAFHGRLEPAPGLLPPRRSPGATGARAPPDCAR